MTARALAALTQKPGQYLAEALKGRWILGNLLFTITTDELGGTVILSMRPRRRTQFFCQEQIQPTNDNIFSIDQTLARIVRHAVEAKDREHTTDFDKNGRPMRLA